MEIKQAVWLRSLVFLLVLVVGAALAQNTNISQSGSYNIGTSISQSISTAFCPIIKLIAGPLFWGVIGVLVMVGLIMMAAASRGFGKYFLYPIVAAILFAVLKGYINNQAKESSTEGASIIQNCLGWK